MNFKELENRILKIVQTGDFKLLQGSTSKFSLKIDGVWHFQKTAEEILEFIRREIKG